MSEKYRVGQILNMATHVDAQKAIQKLNDLGFDCWCGRDKDGGFRILIDAYHSPVTRDEDGYFVEDEALTERLNFEMGGADHFFMTDRERGDSENCLQIVRGKWTGGFWGDDKLYITPELLLYTNLEQAIRTAIPGFDVYGLDYTISKAQWEAIRTIDKGRYLKQAIEELEEWIDKTADPVLTILCI